MKKTIFLISLSWLSINIKAQTHLVLSEIAMQPSAGEFIEIYNPTNSTISLDNYYLSDHSNYYALPSNTYTIDAGDFVVRFPAGATIQAGKTMVIGFSGTDFITTYSLNPDYEIISQNASITDMLSIKTSGIPSITNAGESVILFYWDGTSDLVKDVDLLNVGIPAAGNQLKSKTGLAVDGPDADALTSTYLSDAITIPNQTAAAGSGYSTKRLLLEEGYETLTNGNGITGHDETTENTSLTWDQTYTTPTPGITSISKNSSIKNAVVLASELSIYPNPVVQFEPVNIHINSLINSPEITIYSLLGVLVYEAKISKELSLKLPAGIYFIQVKDNLNYSTQKLVVSEN